MTRQWSLILFFILTVINPFKANESVQDLNAIFCSFISVWQRWLKYILYETKNLFLPNLLQPYKTAKITFNTLIKFLHCIIFFLLHL